MDGTVGQVGSGINYIGNKQIKVKLEGRALNSFRQVDEVGVL
jgi:hypothetical protein